MESHPSGVQFAFRRDCLKIEHKLLSQICHFEGFPVAVRDSLAADGAILTMEVPARCPITRDPLEYEVMLASLEAPKAGLSSLPGGASQPAEGPWGGARVRTHP